MFCLYFNKGPIHNLEDAKKSRIEEFARFFHGCLTRGVYFAPSQFEAGFISTAHTLEVLEETSNVVAEALKKI